MTILVAFASRHDNARGIAETIAAELERRGHRTVFSDVSLVSSLDGFDAVVVGSGLRHGCWLPQTLAFLDRFQPELTTMPVWLFCSGSAGDRQSRLPLELGSRQRGMCLMGHRCFPGSLVTAPVGTSQAFTPRARSRAAHEFHDWDAVSAWARGIGAAAAPLAHIPAATPVTA